MKMVILSSQVSGKEYSEQGTHTMCVHLDTIPSVQSYDGMLTGLVPRTIGSAFQCAVTS